MRRIADRVASWLVSYRGLLAVVAVALAVVSVEQSRRLEFVKSIDTMFDRADPALVPYRRMARAFGSSEVVLAAYDDPDLFTAAGIDRLRSLTTRLGQLSAVSSATSLASTPLGNRIIDIQESPTARKLITLMEGYALGADRRTAAVVCVLKSPDDSTSALTAHTTSRADAIDGSGSVRSICRC
jgi:predicted RND superfamily exporter protein